MAIADVMKMIKENEVKFVDFRFTDTRGKEQHVSVPTKQFTEDKFTDGHAFDGSSIAGWKGIEASDMLLMPDPDSARLDPFTDEPVLNISCDVIEPSDGKGYDRDPRSIAKRGEAYLKSTGLGDTAYFGPEPEFFIFDSVTWKVATPVTGRQSRAAISLSRRWIRCRTSVTRCVSRLSSRVLRSKYTTTKWRPRASAKSAPNSRSW